MPEPIPLQERPRSAQILLACVVPFVFGAIVGIALGASAGLYLGALGPRCRRRGPGGTRAPGRPRRCLRGLLGGVLFACGILLLHAITGAEEKVSLGSVPAFLIVIDAVIGAILSALGALFGEHLQNPTKGPASHDRLPRQARRPAGDADRRFRGARGRRRPGAAAGRHLRPHRQQRHLRGDGRGDELLELLPGRGRLRPGADLGLRRGGREQGRRGRGGHAASTATCLPPRICWSSPAAPPPRASSTAPPTKPISLRLPPLPGKRHRPLLRGRHRGASRCCCGRSSSPRS